VGFFWEGEGRTGGFGGSGHFIPTSHLSDSFAIHFLFTFLISPDSTSSHRLTFERDAGDGVEAPSRSHNPPLQACSVASTKIPYTKPRPQASSNACTVCQ